MDKQQAADQARGNGAPPTIPTGSATGARSVFKRWSRRLAYVYLVAIVASWLLFRFTADNWWAGTAFLYGPRWVLAAPLLLLAPLALVARSWRSVACLAIAGLIAAGPITGGTVSPQTLWQSHERGHIRVLTCNTDGSNLNGAALEALIAQTLPDIVLLQESNAAQSDRIFPAGWNVCRGPMGLCLATRFQVNDFDDVAQGRLDDRGSVRRYRLASSLGELTIVNVHLPTPREGFETLITKSSLAPAQIRAQTEMRNRVSANARAALGEFGPAVIVGGDFNMPVESAIYRRHWSDLDNAFSDGGWGWGFTKHTRRLGVRIDHLLAGKVWRCRQAWVGPDVGSDHLPLIADFDAREQ
jgi:vancomycin resistance protein VanJ